MNILLVNDDGYNAEGIVLLKKLLQKYGNVYMCAPKYHQSGKSAAFTFLSGLKVEKLDEYNYVIDGTPVDCTSFGLTVLDIKFDLVVSGCNNGHNISYDCFYSGTVGACKEALAHDVPAIAVSTDVKHFDIVEKEFDDVFNYLVDNKLISNKYILNVNFPTKLYESSLGIRFTKQYIRKDTFYYQEKDGLIFVDRYEDKESGNSDCDVYAIRNGLISITPLKMTSFDNDLFIQLNEKIKA